MRSAGTRSRIALRNRSPVSLSMWGIYSEMPWTADDASQQHHRIPVERHAEVAVRGDVERREKTARDAGERAGPRASEQQVPAPALLDALHRTGRGPDHLQGSLPRFGERFLEPGAGRERERDGLGLTR